MAKKTGIEVRTITAQENARVLTRAAAQAEQAVQVTEGQRRAMRTAGRSKRSS